MAEKILVIDDEPDMLALLRMIIEDNTDYEIRTANNPSQGLKMFAKTDFDLVITDLKMPGMDGLELVQEFEGINADVPVIIITAYGTVETADEALKKGVVDFIAKPFRKDSILFSIKRALELARVRRENLELKKRVEKTELR
jgi:DNA-binding NtrC family response regulator